MAKVPTTLASEPLKRDAGAWEELRIRWFEEDEEAHDDEAVERLYADFSSHFDGVEAMLSKPYGKPSRTGREDDEVIPLNGVFRFAIWPVADKQLFLAAAHEDRGVPILLMLGTTVRGSRGTPRERRGPAHRARPPRKRMRQCSP